MNILIVEASPQVASWIAETIRNLHAVDSINFLTRDGQYAWPALEKMEMMVAQSDVVIIDTRIGPAKPFGYSGEDVLKLATSMHKRVLGTMDDETLISPNFAGKMSLRCSPKADEALREKVIEVMAEATLAR